MSKKSRERWGKFQIRNIKSKARMWDVIGGNEQLRRWRKDSIVPVVDIQSSYSYLQSEYGYESVDNLGCCFHGWSGDEWIETSFKDFIEFPMMPPFEETFFELKATRNSGVIPVGVYASYYADQKSIFAYVYAANDANMEEVSYLGYMEIYMNDSYQVSYMLDQTLLGSDVFAVAIAAVMATLQFLNCRNIELVDNEPDPDISNQYKLHFGKPLTAYKTLRIKSVGKQSESSNEPKDYQALMPLHLRRGNFATYTDDKPLFGKYTGTFWRPATAVGETKNGVVIKDYEVQP